VVGGPLKAWERRLPTY